MNTEIAEYIKSHIREYYRRSIRRLISHWKK